MRKLKIYLGKETMKKLIPFFALIIFLMSYPLDTQAQVNLERERVARYDINYASYLIEVGKYMEALENYETAIEVTTIEKTKIDALLAKATLLSSFLDAPEEALKTYREIYRKYPQAAQIALYREGLLLFHLNRTDEAKSALEKYLTRFPQGRFRFQTEALLEQIKKIVPPPPPPPPEIKPPEIKPPVIKPPEVKRPEVRVRLCKTTGEVTIKGSSVCAAGLGCDKDFRVRGSDGEISIDGTPLNQRKVFFEGKDLIEIRCGKKKKQVRGKILAQVKGGKLYIINYVDIEDYLKSVVPSESYSSWPLETLKAQAVAARTYAWYQLLHRKTWVYDLVDDEGDQAYKGVKRERAKSTRAVEETSGRILTYKNKPILAMYSANSGGHTADAKSIFNLRKPYLVAHPDPASLKGKMARWTREFSTSEIESALRKRGIRVKGLRRIEPAEKGPSGRIIKIRISSKEGSKVLRTRTTLRRALKLPEILLEIERKNNHFIFNGRGWGHGVGYSQWGSAILGKKTSYDKILGFYYPNALLEKKW